MNGIEIVCWVYAVGIPLCALLYWLDTYTRIFHRPKVSIDVPWRHIHFLGQLSDLCTKSMISQILHHLKDPLKWSMAFALHGHG